MRTRKSLVTLLTMLAIISLIAISCGRTTSRYLGKYHRQKLEVEKMQKFISLSFDKRGSSTVKDVTYLASDDYVYTREFKDVSPLGGVIRWVPHDQDDSFIQSRAISRWTGGAVNIALPDDCAEVLGVDRHEQVVHLLHVCLLHEPVPELLGYVGHCAFELSNHGGQHLFGDLVRAGQHEQPANVLLLGFGVLRQYHLDDLVDGEPPRAPEPPASTGPTQSESA